MSSRLELGNRTIGGPGLSIAAPGQDVRSPAARLLLTSDAQFTQLLFEGDLALQTEQTSYKTARPFDPDNAFTNYVTNGYGTFVFPYALPFAPFCKLSFRFVEDDQQRFQVGTGGQLAYGESDRLVSINYVSFGDRVEVFYQLVRRYQKQLRDVVVHVAVLSVPVDR